jgi:hypothetical protein
MLCGCNDPEQSGPYRQPEAVGGQIMVGRRVGIAWLTGRAIALGVAAVIVVMALRTPVTAHDNGTTLHLWNHIKAMRDVGAINDADNPVDWTKLKGVPSSIADGVDDIGAAGFGLKRLFGIFLVNTSEIQRRVNGACGAGQSIKSIKPDGTVLCTSGPRGFSKTVADTGQICNGFCTEGTLTTLSTGTWAITAKIQIDQTGSDVPLYVQCRLDAGGLSDYALFDVDRDGATEAVTMQLQLIATLSGNLHASVACRDFDVGSAYGSNLSIIAIRLAD